MQKPLQNTHFDFSNNIQAFGFLDLLHQNLICCLCFRFIFCMVCIHSVFSAGVAKSLYQRIQKKYITYIKPCESSSQDEMDECNLPQSCLHHTSIVPNSCPNYICHCQCWCLRQRFSRSFAGAGGKGRPANTGKKRGKYHIKLYYKFQNIVLNNVLLVFFT